MANELEIGQVIDMLGLKITNMAPGTNPMDAVNFSQLSALFGGVIFQGPYNATTNIPNLTTPLPGVVDKGYMYKVDTAGASFFGVQLEIGDTLISNVDNPSSASDWTVLQVNDNWDYAQTVFVGKHGNDTNNGLALNAPKLTLMAGITLALTLSPTPTNRIRVHVLDPGDYNLGTTLVTTVLTDGVDIWAPNARLIGVFRAEFEVGDNYIKAYEIDYTPQVTINKKRAGDLFVLDLQKAKVLDGTFVYLAAPGASGKSIINVGDIVSTSTAGGATAVICNDAAEEVFVNIDSISITATAPQSGNGLNAGNGGTIRGRVGSITFAGTSTTSNGLKASNSSTIDVVVDKIVMTGNTAIDSATSSIIRVVHGEFAGTVVESGGGKVYRVSKEQGVWFPQLVADSGILASDLIKVYNATSGEHETMSITALVALGLVNPTLAATLIAGNTSGSNDIIMDDLFGIVLGVAGNRLDASGNNVTLDATGDLILEFDGGILNLSELASQITIQPNVSGTNFQTSLLNTRTTWNVMGNGAMNARIQLTHGNGLNGYSRLEQAATNLQMIFGAGLNLYIMNGDKQDVDTVTRGITDNNLLYVNAGLDNVGIGTGVPLSKFHVQGTARVVGVAETIQFRVYSHTVSQGNPVMSLYDTSGAISWNFYNSVIRASGRDTKFQSVAGFDVIIARSTGATGTRFDDSGDVTMFYDLEVVGEIKGTSIESYNVVTKTNADSPYTTADGEVVLCNATAGNITVTLPATVNGAQINIKKTDASANTVTIDGAGGDTIDGSLTKVISTQYESLTLVSDGSNWFII